VCVGAVDGLVWTGARVEVSAMLGPTLFMPHTTSLKHTHTHTRVRVRAQFDYLGETTEGNLHFVQRLQRAGVVNLFGLTSLDDIVTTGLDSLQGAVQVRA